MVIAQANVQKLKLWMSNLDFANVEKASTAKPRTVKVTNYYLRHSEIEYESYTTQSVMVIFVPANNSRSGGLHL